MIEEAMAGWERILGITPLEDYKLVDERKQGCVTTRLEVRFERRAEMMFFRLKVTCCKGEGRAGSRRRAFAWPVADPDRPRELLAGWCTQILRAATPGAPVHEDRGAVGRFFDRCLGLTQLNCIPLLAEISGPPRRWVTVHIQQDRSGPFAALTEHCKGRGPLRLVLPLASVAALREWATAAG